LSLVAPSIYLQSLLSLTRLFVSHAAPSILYGAEKRLANLVKATRSFGKHLPPNPLSPSGPGTKECDSPILGSLVTALRIASKSQCSSCAKS